MKVFNRARQSKRDQVPRRRQADASAGFDEPTDTSRRYLRNRTLSQSSIEAEEPSARTRAHVLTRRRRRVGSILVLIAGVCVVLLLLMAQFTAQVTIALGSAVTKQVDTAPYAASINAYLDQHPVERIRFALGKEALNEFIVASDPEIASVEQTTNWGIGATRYTITLRQPVAGWQINGRQYYVDQQGIAFEKNHFADPSVQIVDQSGASLEQGTTVTSTRFLSFVGKLVSQTQGRGYAITEARLPLGTTREVAVKVKDINYEFRLSIDRGAGEQAEDMARVISYLASRSVTPGYVDLRVEGRAFYL